MNKYKMGLVENNPSISKKRSFIPGMSHTAQLDFNAGVLVPLSKPWAVIPSDTWSVGHSLKIRMSNPPKVPPFGQLVFDMFEFYIPNRVVWDKWDDFITGNTGTDWEVISDLTVPYINATTYSLQGSLADYFGVAVLPAGFEGDDRISALPFRAYYSVWNKYFRYEPLQEELYNPTNSSPVIPEDINTATTMPLYYTDIENYMSALRSNAVHAGVLAPVNKLDDYFTRCLPAPLAGPDVSILGLDNAILGRSSSTGTSYLSAFFDDPTNTQDWNENSILSDNSADGLAENETNLLLKDALGTSQASLIGLGSGLTGITGNTIRELRQAMAIDILLTNDARYGRRITENTYAHYGCVIPDYRVDFPEFLGTKRIYINVNQVIQSSSSTEASPQGNVGAWSETTDSGKDFVYSGVEHGYILTLGCVRILNRIYSQGLDPMFRKFSRLSYYTPELANVSDMPVYTSEIYLASEDNSVFGYQEAWSEYRFIQNHIANHMRPTASDTLAVWNYAESYDSAPTLSEAWIIEDPSIIDRTMYMEHSSTVSQFILDIYWDIELYRTIPTHTLVGGLTHSW